MSRFALALFALISFVPLVATAQPWPALSEPAAVEKTGAADVALLIGIEDYLLLPDVPGAAANLNEWETFLRDGLGVGTVITMRNSEAVREEILAGARKATEAAQPGGKVWFVFIGHGAPSKDGKDGVIVGADGQQTVNSLATRSVTQGELAQILSTGPQAQTLMVIDACFSGRDSTGETLAPGAQPVIAIDTMKVPEGVTLMTAAKATEFAGPLPGAPRPAFSYLLLGALRGWGDDGDGEVTASEAVGFARNELREVNGRSQTPQLLGNGNATMARGVSEPRPARIRPGEDEDSIDAGSEPGEITTVHWGSGGAKVQRTGGVPRADDLMYFKGHGGIVGTDGAEDLGPVMLLSLGVKAIRLDRLDLRLGGWLGLHSSSNPRAPSPVVDDFFGTGTVDRRFNWWASLGVGPGVAYRFSSTPSGFDRTVYLDSAFGFGAVLGGQCNDWSEDAFGDLECSQSTSRTDGFVGARLGGEVPLFDLALFTMIRPGASETVVGITAGLSFDR